MPSVRAWGGVLSGVLLLVAGCDAPSTPAQVEPIAPMPASPVPGQATGRPAVPPLTSTSTQVRVTSTVPSPTSAAAAAVPDGATALCNDGTYSFGRARPNTCARHGGVARWL